MALKEQGREIIRSAVGPGGRGRLPLGSRLRNRFAAVGLDANIALVRGGKPRAAVLRK